MKPVTVTLERFAPMFGWRNRILRVDLSAGRIWAQETAPDVPAYLGARGLALAFWAVLVGQRATARLQKDLAYWSLLRSLPFSSGRLLVAELLLPWVLVVLSGLAVLALAGGTWLEALRLPAALLLISTSASASLAMAYDLLRQSQSSMLLNGNAPQISAVGGFLGLIFLALPLGLWFGLSHFKLDGSLPAVALAALLGLLFWNLSKDRLQRME